MADVVIERPRLVGEFGKQTSLTSLEVICVSAGQRGPLAAVGAVALND
jgi:hypothetical protein